MRTFAPVVVAGSLALAATGAGARPPQAQERSCAGGSVKALIGGKPRCLEPGGRCSARFERSYNKYGFHCHHGRLSSDPWAPLRLRRFHLPTVRGSCPRTAAHSVNPSWGIALDDGTPPYPLPFAEGRVAYSRSDLHNGWLFHKTIWIAPVALQGPVLVRGRQLDGQNILKFSSIFPAKFRELRLRFRGVEFGGSGGWQEAAGPRYTLIHAPGCYGLQVDGSSFSKVLVFEAELTAH
jgi:hypothetical protein